MAKDPKGGFLTRGAAMALGAILVGAAVKQRATGTVTADATTGTAERGRATARRQVGDGRGHRATSPTEIPAQGWKEILLRVYREATDDRILTEAAGVTFYALLALVPTLAAFVSIYGLIADPATVNEHLAAMQGVVPGGGMQIIEEQLKRITSQGSQTLGLAFITSLALSLWSSNAGMKSMFDALNVVYEEKEKRGFLKLNAVSLAFTFGAILFLVVALAGVVALPVVLNFIGLGGLTDTLIRLARWPVLIALLVLGLGLLYRYGPSRSTAQWKWITPGGIIAAVAWLIVSIGFSWYVANFGSYNETYGSLGAAIGFMTWIWLSATVILLGAEFNAEMEHQTAADTTTGPPRPIGTRGAEMADKLPPDSGKS